MSKSRTRGGSSIPSAAVSVKFRGGAPTAADLLPRAQTPADSVLAEKLLASGRFLEPVPGLSLGATPVAPANPARARQANRLACDGARLIQKGRLAQAVELLRRSVKLNPGVAASHHDLGVALLNTGQLVEAAESFTAALRLDAGIPSAHYYLAYIFDVQGFEEKAMAGFQAAVKLKPDHGAAQFRLGELYQSRALLADSAAAFRAAAAALTGTLRARIAEARAIEISSSFDEALATVQAIVDEHPDSAEAHSLLGRLLAQAGRTAEAVAHHERAIDLSLDVLVSWSGLATNKKFTADDGPLIARMNAALARPNLTPRHLQSIHFALGKAHDDMGNYEAAMRNFEAGNRARALSGGLNRAALVRRVDQLIEATPPGYRERQPVPPIEDATPVLIVGMPRSGSTLIEQILSSHPDVAAGGELEFWQRRDKPREDEWGIVSTPEAIQSVADDYLATLRAFGPDAKRVTDKALGNFMLLGIVNRVFPNATLIHCRRHPIDNALSILTTNFETNFDFASNRGDLVFFFREYQRLMAHWREVLPPDRLVEVDYEALVADPEPHARRLVSACGLEWNDACLAPHRNTRKINTASLWQARQPIYRTSVERWRRYEPWLGELRDLAPKA
jgi:tetratricopeptide (TPR) repeat protein